MDMGQHNYADETITDCPWNPANDGVTIRYDPHRLVRCNKNRGIHDLTHQHFSVFGLCVRREQRIDSLTIACL